MVHAASGQLRARLQIANVDDGLAGLVHRIDVEKAVRINEVELLYGTFDPNKLIGVEMGCEAMMSASERRNCSENQAEGDRQ